MNLSIDIDQYNELLRLDGTPFAKSVLEVADEVIAGGGVVKIEMRYANAPAELVGVIRTKADLARWAEDIKRVTDNIRESQKNTDV